MKKTHYCVLFALLLATYTKYGFAESNEKALNGDIANGLVKKLDLEKMTAKLAVAEVFRQIEGKLQEGKNVTIKGFGSFYLSKRKAHKGRNPKTGEEINIPEKQYPKFKSSKLLKDRFNPKK